MRANGGERALGKGGRAVRAGGLQPRLSQEPEQRLGSLVSIRAALGLTFTAAVMPSEFEWSGSSLRGSLGSLKKGGWHLVGSSPSALSPCETSSWDIGLFGQTPGHFDSSKGPFRLCRQSEFPVNHGPCKIRITDTNRLTPTSPAPLVFILSPSDFTHMDNRCAIVKLGPGLAAHLAANSTLELEVLAKGEAAVLTSAEEPNPRPATTYVTGEHV